MGDRLRVLSVTTDLAITGAKRVLVDGAVGVDRSRFEPSVLLLSKVADDDPLRLELTSAGVPVHHVRVKSRLDGKGLRALRPWLERERPDLIHTHCARSAAILRLAVRGPDRPRVVVHFHGTVSHRALRMKHRWIDRAVRGRTDLVLAPTEHAARRGERAHAFRGLPVRILPNGVDLGKVRRPIRSPEETRARWGVPASAQVVLLIGRWGPSKGHDLLLDAVPSVLARPGDVRFVFVAPDGGGAFRSSLERLVRETALRRHVVLAGRTTDPAACYAAADVVAMPSRDEPFGLVAVEAMANGRPLVVARVGGLPEVCGDDAGVFWVRPGDPDDLARALVAALSEDPASRAARVALHRARAECFSLPRYLAGLEAAYADAASGRCAEATAPGAPARPPRRGRALPSAAPSAARGEFVIGGRPVA
jgi:glycosyltransferase involved in cell wall biosynthesis